MDDLKALAALTALNEMFAGSHLSICTIDKVATLLGVHPERDAYDTLHALHCVHWNKMPRELRDRVPELIQRALGNGTAAFQFELKQPSNNALQLLDQSKHTRRPLLQRLINR
ncbi:TPA: hypothetical protein QEM98_000427 [Stenotrophomonas maltophilia]|nr:hypothetical protein [Stenotrophomonas maltophilia]